MIALAFCVQVRAGLETPISCDRVSHDFRSVDASFHDFALVNSESENYGKGPCCGHSDKKLTTETLLSWCDARGNTADHVVYDAATVVNDYACGAHLNVTSTVAFGIQAKAVCMGQGFGWIMDTVGTAVGAVAKVHPVLHLRSEFPYSVTKAASMKAMAAFMDDKCFSLILRVHNPSSRVYMGNDDNLKGVVTEEGTMTEEQGFARLDASKLAVPLETVYDSTWFTAEMDVIFRPVTDYGAFATCFSEIMYQLQDAPPPAGYGMPFYTVSLSTAIVTKDFDNVDRNVWLNMMG